MAAFDEKEYTQAFDWSIWKRLFPILSRFKRYFIGMIGTAAVSDLVDAAMPLFQMYAIAQAMYDFAQECEELEQVAKSDGPRAWPDPRKVMR